MAEPSKELKLTPKQRIFVAEYMIDLNATQAAIRAGYSENTAQAIGAENLTKPLIQAALDKRMEERAKRTEVTADRIINETAKLAFFDAKNLFNSDGTPKAIHELDDDVSAAIAGIEVVTVGNKEYGLGQITKYKIADKNSALEKLYKHNGLYAPVKQDVTSNGNELKSITIINAEDLVNK
jgi:phage terminase small subunit